VNYVVYRGRIEL